MIYGSTGFTLRLLCRNKMTSGIYEILNTTNSKRYIGSAINLVSRWRSHRDGLRAGRHINKHLQSAWNKYGEKSFKFLPILTCAKSMPLFYEQQLLDKVKPEYNICPTAGSQLGSKRAPGFQRGRVQSEDTRKKISKGHKGKKCPAVSEANKKRVFTEKTLTELSEAKRGKPQSANHVAKRAKAMIGNTNSRGKTRSREAIEKSSAANRGRKRTPEQLANIARGKQESRDRRAALKASLQNQPQGV